MTYRDAQKVKPGQLVYVPRLRENVCVIDVEDENHEVFIHLKDVPHDCPKQFHHTAVQNAKTTEQIAGIYLADPKTRVFINHNDETGEWRWAVEVVDSNGFWLDSFPTEDEAKQYIAEQGLKQE